MQTSHSAVRWHHGLTLRSRPGSLLGSLGAHLLLSAAVVGWVGTRVSTPLATPSPETEMQYELFEEPPEIVPKAQVARSLPQEVLPLPDAAPKAAPAQELPRELQDAASEIAGTQGAAPAVPASDTGSAQGAVAAVPYYKIKPKYPRAALVNGDQGWVLLRVDVTETGEVENIRVVDGENRNLFQDEARRAVSKWKYKPFTNAAGSPIRKADHPVRIDFNLDEA